MVFVVIGQAIIQVQCVSSEVFGIRRALNFRVRYLHIHRVILKMGLRSKCEIPKKGLFLTLCNVWGLLFFLLRQSHVYQVGLHLTLIYQPPLTPEC